MSAPVASILIPNFNNGQASSRDGRSDFLGDLLASLAETLHADPTPLEIILVDDGSTDDSLETARQWARRSWRSGEPFCRLVELPHCGVLSRVLNRLMRLARGEFLLRLDGDVVVHTPRWVERIVEHFRANPRAGVIAGMQLAPDGRIHALGDWIIHPRGYHHAFQGADPGDAPPSLEVDHVMGCFHCLRRAAQREIGTYDESILRGQTEDYGVRLRLAGWSALAVSDVRFTHRHAQRRWRDNVADSPAALDAALARFRAKWGFDRLAPDLDSVRRRYAGTPLFWNTALRRAPARAASAPTIEGSDWARYAQVGAARTRIDCERDLAAQLLKSPGSRQSATNSSLLHIGCGDGVLCHLLASGGVEAVGIDEDPGRTRLASDVTARGRYPGPRPNYVPMGAGPLPFETAAFSAVLVTGVIEIHPNPVRLLTEIRRVLRPGGAMAIRTLARPTFADAGEPGVHRFLSHELVQFVHHSLQFEPDLGAVLRDGDHLCGVWRRADRTTRPAHLGRTGDSPVRTAAPAVD